MSTNPIDNAATVTENIVQEDRTGAGFWLFLEEKPNQNLIQGLKSLGWRPSGSMKAWFVISSTFKMPDGFPYRYVQRENPAQRINKKLPGLSYNELELVARVVEALSKPGPDGEHAFELIQSAVQSVEKGVEIDLNPTTPAPKTKKK